jgi:hypothetical protein
MIGEQQQHVVNVHTQLLRFMGAIASTKNISLIANRLAKQSRLIGD